MIMFDELIWYSMYAWYNKCLHSQWILIALWRKWNKHFSSYKINFTNILLLLFIIGSQKQTDCGYYFHIQVGTIDFARNFI